VNGAATGWRNASPDFQFGWLATAQLGNLLSHEKKATNMVGRLSV
jgi:hypothetical protein